MYTMLAMALLAVQFGRGTDRVCVYQDIHYEGWSECYSPGDELPSLRNHSNDISSIRVFGRAFITVFDDTNFSGRSAEFARDVPDLGLRNLAGSRSWSDRIKSFVVGPENNRRGPSVFRQQQ